MQDQANGEGLRVLEHAVGSDDFHDTVFHHLLGELDFYHSNTGLLLALPDNRQSF